MKSFIDRKAPRGTLNDFGRRYFNTHFKRSVSEGVLQESDWDNWLELCRYFGEMKQIRREVSSEGEMIKGRDGNLVRNPKLIRLKDIEAKFLRLSGRFALDPASRKRVKKNPVAEGIDMFDLYFHQWPQWLASIDRDIPNRIPDKFLGHEWSPCDRYGQPEVMTQTREEMTLENRAEGMVMGWRLSAMNERSYPKDQAEYALIEEFKQWEAKVDRSKAHPLQKKYLGYRWSPKNAYGEWLTELPSEAQERADKAAAIDAALAELRGDVAGLLVDVRV